MIVYDIQHLVKLYPGQTQPANKDITLQIQQGEIFGLLGENGAGKSTLVRQMANLLRPTSGEITLLGKPLTADGLQVPLHVGYMPQELSTLNSLTVGEALYFTAHLRGWSRGDAQQERESLLALWQIEAMRHRPIMRLSGGQKRLAQLAIAMAGDPPVLILDEPTAGLDPQRRKLVWDILRRRNAERGTTIIFITHDAIEAEKIIQRVGILRAGELAALGRPSELKRLVDRKLRLELFFSPEAPPELPEGLAYRALDAGRWVVLLEWAEMMPTLNRLDLEQVDDFRLYSATLEDLYLHYVNNTKAR